MAVLVDTDVFPFIFKNDSRRDLYKPYLEDQFPYISFMTFAELKDWTLKHNWGVKLIAELDEALKQYSIQHSNPQICKLWSEVVDESRRKGRQISTSDAWVAATAISLDVPLISHNARHFKHIERLELITERSL